MVHVSEDLFLSSYLLFSLVWVSVFIPVWHCFDFFCHTVKFKAEEWDVCRYFFFFTIFFILNSILVQCICFCKWIFILSANCGTLISYQFVYAYLLSCLYVVGSLPMIYFIIWWEWIFMYNTWLLWESYKYST